MSDKPVTKKPARNPQSWKSKRAQVRKVQNEAAKLRKSIKHRAAMAKEGVIY